MSGSAMTMADVLAMVPADDRVDLAWNNGTATVIRVGLVTLRSAGDGTADGHSHDSVDEAQACFMANVEQAQALASGDLWSAAASMRAQLQALTASAQGPTGMYV